MAEPKTPQELKIEAAEIFTLLQVDKRQILDGKQRPDHTLLLINMFETFLSETVRTIDAAIK